MGEGTASQSATLTVPREATRNLSSPPAALTDCLCACGEAQKARALTGGPDGTEDVAESERPIPSIPFFLLLFSALIFSLIHTALELHAKQSLARLELPGSKSPITGRDNCQSLHFRTNKAVMEHQVFPHHGHDPGIRRPLERRPPEAGPGYVQTQRQVRAHPPRRQCVRGNHP